MAYLIQKELLQWLLNYLAARPYVEIYRVIDQLQKLKEVPDKEEMVPNILPSA